MKKLIYVLIIMLGLGLSDKAFGQAQDIEQLTLDIEKLAQFKQILADMKKGYDVISSGYSTISGISQGTFNLHQSFLNGLLAISPPLKAYSRVAQIITCQETILSEYKSAYSSFKNGGRFTPTEISYMGTVYKNLFNQSVNNLSALTMVMTSSQLRMSDDERLRQIDGIDKDMQDKLSFLRSFNNRQAALDTQRARQQQDSKSLQQLYVPQ
ncbi:TerB family tellurite resistance protein [Mucilaginibacter sp. dw_454]|uniref:TerB family tellurite resistance protein n=1 Tax=Mucilaginibacter sp. dw_454 TaxID=2720079 RepID=UPI001BD2BC1C|nr:TerB family tellurite resistance protein [Mucilaginibacter sp. dw_454]